MIGLNVLQHLPDLLNQVDRLVEGQHEVAFGELNRFGDVNHCLAEAPGTGRSIERRIMSLRDEEAVLSLLRDECPLDLFDPPPDRTEMWRQHELVAVAEVT